MRRMVVVLAVFVALLNPSPVTGETHTTQYSESEATDLYTAANYLGMSPGAVQQFGVMAARFVLELSGASPQPIRVPGDTGPYPVRTDYPSRSDAQAALHWVAGFYSVDGPRAQRIGATFMVFLAGTDAALKGLPYPTVRPPKQATSTTVNPVNRPPTTKPPTPTTKPPATTGSTTTTTSTPTPPPTTRPTTTTAAPSCVPEVLELTAFTDADDTYLSVDVVFIPPEGCEPRQQLCPFPTIVWEWNHSNDVSDPRFFLHCYRVAEGPHPCLPADVFGYAAGDLTRMRFSLATGCAPAQALGCSPVFHRASYAVEHEHNGRTHWVLECRP